MDPVYQRPSPKIFEGPSLQLWFRPLRMCYIADIVLIPDIGEISNALHLKIPCQGLILQAYLIPKELLIFTYKSF